MKKIDSNKAFQNILKNAPEMPQPKMPQPQMPDLNPKSSMNMNWWILGSLGLLVVGQFITYMALFRYRKDIFSQLNNNGILPKINESPNATDLINISTNEPNINESSKVIEQMPLYTENRIPAQNPEETDSTLTKI